MIKEINDIEFESVETINEFQNKRLQEALRYLEANSAFIKECLKTMELILGRYRLLKTS